MNRIAPVLGRLGLALLAVGCLGMFQSYILSTFFKRMEGMMFAELRMYGSLIVPSIVVGSAVSGFFERMGIPFMIAIPLVFTHFGLIGLYGFYDPAAGALPAVGAVVITLPSVLLGVVISGKIKKHQTKSGNA